MGVERGFKGVLIPSSVWLDSRLDALCKVIFGEIDSLDGNDGFCEDDEYLARFCHCDEQEVESAISTLESLDYIYREKGRRKRVLRSQVSHPVSGHQLSIPSKSCKPKRKATFDEVIAERTSYQPLVDAINDFIEMRERIRKPLTERALRIRLNKLWTLGQTDQMRVRIVEQSIASCWQDFFPLKDGVRNAEYDTV